MGLIDGTTRDECLSLEALMQNYAANGQWLQAWVVSSNIALQVIISSKPNARLNTMHFSSFCLLSLQTHAKTVGLYHIGRIIHLIC